MNEMTASRQPTHVGAVIPVRSLASRLPNKPLLDVEGVTAIERIVALAQRCHYVEDVVIATTTDPSDDEIAAFAAARGWRCHRGSVNDVLKRLAEAARKSDFEIVVEIDGDDLLCSPEYMDRGVERIREAGVDFVSFSGLPIGATPNVLRAEALERAVALKHYNDTATGFFHFIEASGHFRVERIPVTDARHHHATVRMTLDYPEDLEFFRAVYREIDRGAVGDTLADLVELFQRRPDIVAVNGGLDEQYCAHFRAGLKGQLQ